MVDLVHVELFTVGRGVGRFLRLALTFGLSCEAMASALHVQVSESFFRVSSFHVEPSSLYTVSRESKESHHIILDHILN